jgi:hypothetical protein
MVFGAIINWTVGKTLDLTFDAIWWVTKKTGQGIYNAGQYLIIRKNKDTDNNVKDIDNNDELISLIKEQNKLLTEEIRLLHNTQSNTEEIKEKEEIKEIKEKTD